MLCERCHQHEAVVHELTIQNGQPMERHLCKSCADAAGIDEHPGGSAAGILTKLLVTEAASAIGPVTGPRATSPARELTCPSCGLRYSEFRQSGLMGCAECYNRFADRLGPLLERAQDGGCHHVGKLPRRALAASRLRASAGHSDALEALIGDQRARSDRLRALREHLGRALTSENYERAAMLRDEISRLGELAGDDQAGGDQAGGEHGDQGGEQRTS